MWCEKFVNWVVGIAARHAVHDTVVLFIYMYIYYHINISFVLIIRLEFIFLRT